MSYSVDEIQEELLILLRQFHDICIKNGIKYSLYAGTLIGAVREKGFIEWDDDVDISFTRAEYNKFREVITKVDLGDEFRFSEFDNAFPQLWMKRPGRCAVWLDFFIYDFITANKLGQKVKFALIAFYLGIMKNKQTMILTKERGLYTGLKYAVVYCLYLLGKPFSARFKARQADKFRQSLKGDCSLIHRSNDRYIGIAQVHPKSVMEEYMMTPFEDTELMITKDYHRILVASYDENYMTPKKPSGGEGTVHNSARIM